jgi:hypothetical protein
LPPFTFIAVTFALYSYLLSLLCRRSIFAS